MHTQLTPNAERALLAYLESALVHDEFTHADPWPIATSLRSRDSTYQSPAFRPLDFNRPPEMPTLPDWFEYHAVDDFDLYLYH